MGIDPRVLIIVKQPLRNIFNMESFWEKLQGVTNNAAEMVDIASQVASVMVENSKIPDVTSSATEMVDLAGQIASHLVDTAKTQVNAGVMLGEMIKEKTVEVAMEKLL